MDEKKLSRRYEWEQGQKEENDLYRRQQLERRYLSFEEDRGQPWPSIILLIGLVSTFLTIIWLL